MGGLLRCGRRPRIGPKEVETIERVKPRWALPFPRTGRVLHAHKKLLRPRRTAREFMTRYGVQSLRRIPCWPRLTPRRPWRVIAPAAMFWPLLSPGFADGPRSPPAVPGVARRHPVGGARAG